MEHIEEAGIHSGDSACSLPPQNLSPEVIAELKRQTAELAFALKVGGLMNVQYALKDGVIYLLEVNPRASRTVPFVAKAIGGGRDWLPAAPSAIWSTTALPPPRSTRCLKAAHTSWIR